MSELGKKFYDIFEKIEQEYDELDEFCSSVEIMSDHKLYNYYLSRKKEVEEIAITFKKLKAVEDDILAIREMQKQDSDDSFNDELEELIVKQENLLNKLKIINAEKQLKELESVQIEIHSNESDEFSSCLFEIFENFISNKNYKINFRDDKSSTKVIVANGENIFKNLNSFSGKVKRILRGREVCASVVVLKLCENSVEIRNEDLIIQTSKSGGAGGQHINKTESAVKIIHKPTGIFAECQDERSQLKNKEKALIALKQKINQYVQEKSKREEKNQRDELKDRLFSTTSCMTFDYDANIVRVTSNKQEYKLEEILKGNLDLIINDKIG